jgi:hypothetical protein
VLENNINHIIIKKTQKKSHFIGYSYTCPLISSHHIGSGVFCNWALIMALTPSLEASPPVMGRSKLVLISWPSHLLFEVSPPVVMRRSDLGSYHGQHTFYHRQLHPLN